MIKGWLTQIVAKLRELAPDECGKLDFPIGLEVDSSGDNSGWVVRVDEKRIETRSKKEDEAKVTFYVNQNYLRALSINLRTKYWREAFDARNITANVGDAGQKKKLEGLVKAIEKKEAESAAKP